MRGHGNPRLCDEENVQETNYSLFHWLTFEVRTSVLSNFVYESRTARSVRKNKQGDD